MPFPEPALQRQRQFQRQRDWFLLSLLMLGITLWWSTQGQIQRFHSLVQDVVVRAHAPAPHPDIVLVAIDDRSLAAIGRWPWRRALHAQVLNELLRHEPRAIGLDVLLHDEDHAHPGDDALLAALLQTQERIVLPATLSPAAAGSPSPWQRPSMLLQDAVAHLGHAHVEADPDGLVRRLPLYLGPPGEPLPHLALAMYCLGQGPAPTGLCSTPAASILPEMLLRPLASGQKFAQYSFIDVLRGDVPDAALRGKYILVGATATGMAQSFYLPVGLSSRPLPNIEASAHALNALLSGTPWHSASPQVNATLNFLAVAAVLLAVPMLGPSATLTVCLLVPLALLLLTLALPWLYPLVLAPAPAMLASALVYPLWSWRRLSEAAQFLETEMQRLQQQGLPLTPRHQRDLMEHRFLSIEHATRQLQEMHQFVKESVRQLPLPIFITDSQGMVLLHNEAAHAYAPPVPGMALTGCALNWILRDLRHPDTNQPLLQSLHFRQHQLPDQHEGIDAQGRTMLALCRPFLAGTHSGWQVALVDITVSRQAVLQRDQAMYFISHDIRAPIGSILTLLEMQRNHPGQWPTEVLHERIERYARRSLSMAQDFTQLFSASQQPLKRSVIDLQALLEEVIDSQWVNAHEARITLQQTLTREGAMCEGDRNLLRRAIENVLGNAIKYSPHDTTVECSLWPSDGTGTYLEGGSFWCIAIQDQGPGIPAALQPRLFEPFARLEAERRSEIPGSGLGLAMARTVMQRHHGGITLHSSHPGGSVFWLWIPQLSTPRIQAPGEDVNNPSQNPIPLSPLI